MSPTINIIYLVYSNENVIEINRGQLRPSLSAGQLKNLTAPTDERLHNGQRAPQKRFDVKEIRIGGAIVPHVPLISAKKVISAIFN